MTSLRDLIERRLDDATARDGAGRIADADATWPLLVLAALDGPDALESTLAPSAGDAPASTAGPASAPPAPTAPTAATPSATTAATPSAPTAATPANATATTTAPTNSSTSSSAAAATDAPTPAHLLAITVEGFRGVGPPARLDLAPGPGLTLVVGRNGSGKSSFAEAAELLLTGDTYRWSHRKTSVWRDGWRNLHHPRAAIACELAIEGQPGKTTIARTWPDDATDVATGPPTTAQLAGRPRTTLDDPASPLRWGDAITSYRPFLSYNELGSMLDEEPSKLYDALSAILGLGDLTTARDTLAAARKPRDATVKAANERRKQLLVDLAAHPDPRAAPLAAQLGKTLDRRDWGLDDALRLATAGLDATTGADPTVAALGALARLPAPDVAAATAAADALHAAAQRRAATAGTLAARADQLATLLDHALRFHADHGDGDCPVCGRPAALDATWHATKAAEATALRDTARAATEAQQACAAALRQLRTLPLADAVRAAGAGHHRPDDRPIRPPLRRPRHHRPRPPPPGRRHRPRPRRPHHHPRRPHRHRARPRRPRRRPPPRRPAPRGGPAGPSHGSRRRARPPRRSLAPARRPRRRLRPRRPRGARRQGHRRRPQERRRLALHRRRRHPPRPLRPPRRPHPRPLGEPAPREQRQPRAHRPARRAHPPPRRARRRRRRHRRRRRQDPRRPRRDEPGRADALALSLFIPRATLAESPFRFLLIDDPVQSMDPARVDGLARVLHHVAADRQVIVFTHDDRLPEAVRRLGLAAHVLEVTRRPGSIVELRTARDPVARALDDARALALESALPPETARRVIPGLCRQAIEAACTETIRRRRLARGDRHADVDALLADAIKLYPLTALALFDDPNRDGDVLTALNNRVGPFAAGTFKACNEGAHGTWSGDTMTLVRDTERIARALQSIAAPPPAARTNPPGASR